MVLAINGNSRRSSTTVANLPLCSKAVRIVAASTLGEEQGGSREMRTSTGKRRMVATLRPADSFHYPARCGAAVGVLSRPQQMWCETPASSQPHGTHAFVITDEADHRERTDYGVRIDHPVG